MSFIFILTGMSGVGKSHYGQMIAKSLGFNFIDTDDLIVTNYNNLPDREDEPSLTLGQIVKKISSEDFKRLELEVILDLSPGSNTIVATGGSVIYSNKSMKKLDSIGTIIYLEATTEYIRKQIDDIDNRGIIGSKPDLSFEKIHQERVKMYSAWSVLSNCKIHMNNFDASGVFAELVKIITEREVLRA